MKIQERLHHGWAEQWMKIIVIVYIDKSKTYFHHVPLETGTQFSKHLTPTRTHSDQKEKPLKQNLGFSQPQRSCLVCLTGGEVCCKNTKKKEKIFKKGQMYRNFQTNW